MDWSSVEIKKENLFVSRSYQCRASGVRSGMGRSVRVQQATPDVRSEPVAFVVEQAGGVATGRERILDVTPPPLPQRVPVFFGSKNEVDTWT
jgi:hypothetical protein